MPKSLKILWSGLLNAYDGAFMLVLSNVLFTFLLVPATLIELGLITLLLGLIALSLGVAGLYYTNFQLACGESVDWKTFFEGIKLHWWNAARWTLFNLVVGFSLTWYILFFLQQHGLWAAALSGLSLGLLAIWVLIQFFTFPMMLMQEKPAFFSALRNVVVFIIRWPGYSTAFLVPILVVLVASLFFPPIFILIGAGLVAFLGSYAVHYKLDEAVHPELYRDPKQMEKR